MHSRHRKAALKTIVGEEDRYVIQLGYFPLTLCYHILLMDITCTVWQCGLLLKCSEVWAWRDGSVFRINGCSSRGPKFESQHHIAHHCL